MERKDAAAFLAPLAPFVQRVIAVPVEGEGKAHAPQTLADVARAACIAHAQPCETMEDAVKCLASEAKGTLLIAGSLFLAGEVLKNHA